MKTRFWLPGAEGKDRPYCWLPPNPTELIEVAYENKVVDISKRCAHCGANQNIHRKYGSRPGYRHSLCTGFRQHGMYPCECPCRKLNLDPNL